MGIDNFLIIVCAVLTVVGFIGHRYFSENVYLTYKDQKVGGGK